MFTTKTAFKRDFKRKINSLFGKSLEESSVNDRYIALASLLSEEINERWMDTNSAYLARETRQVYYFSLEFLVGQFLESNLIYLGVREACEQGLKEMGLSLGELIDAEPDAGLGNGGLGRLAACFLDSLAALQLPGHGCGIRYKYGLFSQKIVDGYQVELPDNWLRESNVWEIRKSDKAVMVKFGGNIRSELDNKGNPRFIHENYLPVMAVPYDMPILGYKGNVVNTLRLWSAEAVDQLFDFASFSRGEHINAVSNRYAVEAISEVLYPDDSNYKNRQLRLKQQYFFVSAGLQSIVRRYKKNHSDLSRFAEFICIQINDTHPALAVLELMRILMDEEGFGWDEAWEVTKSTIAYTNHTIMPEALEKWPEDTFRELLPRIHMIADELNRRFCAELMKVYPQDLDRVSRMAIIGDGQIRMAHLAIVGSFSVNGVAAVHSELLKSVVLREFYEYYPEKFNNKTNGITHRRWLLKSNPSLSELISENIGMQWIRDPVQMRFMTRFKGDKQVLGALGRIKRDNKIAFSNMLKEKYGISADPDSIFDFQVKRIHAYKRQLLNLLHIMYLFDQVKNGIDIGPPRTFLLAGKAAPSYYYAKSVIKLAAELSQAIESEPRCKGKLACFFLENYGIRLAEHIFPAAEVSEQISTASKEASGTSNMKFMMNGALTVGTGDGANIEIADLVGEENFFRFGLTVDEVLNYYANGNYRAVDVLENDERLKRAFELMRGGLSQRVPVDEFVGILRSLTDYNDEFFVLKDFDSYVAVQNKLAEAYLDRDRWNAMSLVNIAHSGCFSSDNTISQYARDIWRLDKFHF